MVGGNHVIPPPRRKTKSGILEAWAKSDVAKLRNTHAPWGGNPPPKEGGILPHGGGIFFREIRKTRHPPWGGNDSEIFGACGAFWSKNDVILAK